MYENKVESYLRCTMDRLLVSDPDAQCLQDILGSNWKKGDKCCNNNDALNNNNSLDMTECISNLNLSNGAMLSVLSSSSGSTTASGPKTMKAKSSQQSVDDKWEPFPELSQRQKTSSRRRSSSRIATFGDYSSDSMHVVEAQPKGPIQRMYMCQFGASQFQLHLPMRMFPVFH